MKVDFDNMPAIQLESYKSPAGSSLLKRLAIASRRRRFSLREDWRIKLDGVDYGKSLNGTIEVPAKDSTNRSLIFDGASIPLPWLISLLTVGILRPLGIMLVASIVHDYAYHHGSLRIQRQGEQDFIDVPITRERADRLFKDIISTVNELPIIAAIAWFFVRLGWFWVRYDGKRFGGQPPVKASGILVLLIALLVGISSLLSLSTLLYGVMALYLVLNALGTLINRG